MGKLGMASASPLHSRSPSPSGQRSTTTAAGGSILGMGREGLGGLLGNNQNSQYHSHYMQYGREHQQAQHQPQYHHHGHGNYQQHSQQGNFSNSPRVSHAQASASQLLSQHSYGTSANGININMASSHIQPTSSQVPSKRDKRRNLLSDKLTELSVSFERDKDIHYRNQLAALQQDLSAIARTDISGRDLRMLDDSVEGIDNFVTGGARVGDGAPMSNIRGSGSSGGAMGGVQPGAFYAGFVAEVNEKMEERDVALTLLHKQYHAKVAAIKAQHERSLHHAREEHISLAVTMKQRLINRLYNAKKKLSLDKEHLDISDTTALLLHPNQFSIGSAAAGVLGSPSRNDIDRGSDTFGSGGAINSSNGTSSGSRRKLRQRRNELDDLMMMGPGGIFDNFGRKDSDNGDAKSAAAQRRKARAARYNRRINGGVGEDEENIMEDIYGNVHTNGGTDGDGNNSGSNSVVGQPQLSTLLQATQKQTKVQTVGNGHAAAVQQIQAQELLHKQVYSIEKLFTEKELQMAGNLAALATVKYFSKPKERGSRKSKKRGAGDEEGLEPGTNEDSDVGAKTPREDAEPKGDDNATTTIPTTASFTTANRDDQAKTHEKDSTGSSSPLDLSGIPPAALFSSVIASSANHTRSTNLSLPPTHATPLINPTALNSHPPPSIIALNFMTPTSTGYGAPVWQSLGVQASYFSAGSGSIVNSITTAKMMTLSAPCPGAARSEEALEDLELIRSGRGLVEEEGTGDEVGEESRSREPVEGRRGRKGREEKEREREREREKEKEKEKEGSPSPPLREEGKRAVGLGLGLNVDEQDGEEHETEGKEKEEGDGSSALPPLPPLPSLAVSELAHGVKRRSSSGSGGTEKRARKETDGVKEKEREEGRGKERERAREIMDDEEEGEAEEGS